MRKRADSRFILTLAAALLATLAIASAEPPAEPAPDAYPAAAATPGEAIVPVPQAAPGAAGVRVYLDPETGRLVRRPFEPELQGAPHETPDRLSTYGGDLQQVALPKGGFKVDLRGRFQSAVVATIDPETDEVEIDCVKTPVAPEAGDDR